MLATVTGPVHAIGTLMTTKTNEQTTQKLNTGLNETDHKCETGCKYYTNSTSNKNNKCTTTVKTTISLNDISRCF